MSVPNRLQLSVMVLLSTCLGLVGCGEPAQNTADKGASETDTEQSPGGKGDNFGGSNSCEDVQPAVEACLADIDGETPECMQPHAETIESCCQSGGALDGESVCQRYDDYIEGLRCDILDGVAQDCAAGRQDYAFCIYPQAQSGLAGECCDRETRPWCHAIDRANNAPTTYEEVMEDVTEEDGWFHRSASSDHFFDLDVVPTATENRAITFANNLAEAEGLELERIPKNYAIRSGKEFVGVTLVYYSEERDAFLYAHAKTGVATKPVRKFWLPAVCTTFEANSIGVEQARLALDQVAGNPDAVCLDEHFQPTDIEANVAEYSETIGERFAVNAGVDATPERAFTFTADGQTRGHLIEFDAGPDPTMRVLVDTSGEIVAVWDDEAENEAFDP